MDRSDGSETVHKNVCSICQEDFDFYAYGACNHATCAKCVVKLRKFGEGDSLELKCPTCRQKLEKIVIMDRFLAFDEINIANLLYDPEFDFSFERPLVQQHYRNFLKSVCPVCGEEKKSLSALNRHTTHAHQLSYCDLCIRFARLLPCEFIPMNFAQLAQHRNWDKKNKKGHPLCNFCQERFYELEDLIRHIRDRHFLCDLCISSGQIVVFREQHELLEHYGNSHHLCKDCRAQERISCFATADQLGLHRFQEHPDEVAKDPNAWLPVSIQLVPANSIETARAGGSSIQPVFGADPATRMIAESTDSGIRYRRPNPAEWTGDDFPSLLPHQRSKPSGQHSTVRDSPISRDTGPQPARDSTQAPIVQPASNSSLTLADVTARGRNTQLTADDFPCLPGSTNAISNKPTWAAHGIRNPRNHGCRNSPKGTEDVLSATVPRPSHRTASVNETIPQPSEFPSLPSHPPSDRSVLTHSALGEISRGKSTKHSFNQSKVTGNTPVVKRDQGSNRLVKKRGVVNDDSLDTTAVREETSYNHIQVVESEPPTSAHENLSHTVSRKPVMDDFPILASVTENTLENCQLRPETLGPGDRGAPESRNKQKKQVKGSQLDSNLASQMQQPSFLDPECVLFAEFDYAPLPDAPDRNRELIRAVESTMLDYGGKNTFTRFADLSRRYSHKELSAVSYVEGLIGLVVPKAPGDPLKPPTWIASMVALLPDIGLQRALLRALQGQGAPRLPQEMKKNILSPKRRPKESPIKPPSWAKDVLGLLQCCQVCGQVCLRTDMKSHNLVHVPQR